MKSFKKIISLILLSCVLFSVIALTSCDNEKTDDNGDNPQNPTSGNTYTVTVVDQDNNPISDVNLMISDSSTIFINGKTGSDGKFSTETDGTNLSVMIVNVPSGYTKPEGLISFNGEKQLTVTVTKKTEVKVTYSVKVVDQDGNAVEGVSIQLCPNGTCLPDSFTTDSNGTITKDMTPDLPVDVKIITVPDGYSKPEPLDANGYHAKIATGETQVTITITKN